MINIKHKGNFKHLEEFMKNNSERNVSDLLRRYGELGVRALRDGTPKDSGITAESWDYKIERSPDHTSITWVNNSENKDVNIAVILQYGHGTGTGGYVKGIDYINPSMKPVFEAFADELWKEVCK